LLERRTIENDIVVIALEGEVDIYIATEFKRVLLDSLVEGHVRIVIDTTKVGFMDSSALSALISGERRLREKGFSLHVVGQSEVVRLLSITGLDRVFPIFPTLQEAIEAVAAQGPTGGPNAPGARRTAARPA
jgi:anti-sigma B factor antagonist